MVREFFILIGVVYLGFCLVLLLSWCQAAKRGDGG